MHLRQWFAASLLSVAFLSQMVIAADYPTRGMSMASVKAQYGAPQSVPVSSGQVKKKWPRITVWKYGNFSVYFERSTVLHTVVHH